jgi:hypothetical protein
MCDDRARILAQVQVKVETNRRNSWAKDLTVDEDGKKKQGPYSWWT